MFVRHFENIMAIVEKDNMASVRCYTFTFKKEGVGGFLICLKNMFYNLLHFHLKFWFGFRGFIGKVRQYILWHFPVSILQVFPQTVHGRATCLRCRKSKYFPLPIARSLSSAQIRVKSVIQAHISIWKW